MRFVHEILSTISLGAVCVAACTPAPADGGSNASTDADQESTATSRTSDEDESGDTASEDSTGPGDAESTTSTTTTSATTSGTTSGTGTSGTTGPGTTTTGMMTGTGGATTTSGTGATETDPSGDSSGDDDGVGDATPSPGCGNARTLQDGNLTLQSGGTNRTYHLKTPSDYDPNRPYRVIFMFHWNYGSIDAIVNPPDADFNTDEPYYGLEDLAGDSTIFVVPQGLSDSGGAGWSNRDGQDVNFFDDMLAAISADLCIDTSRVFTTGFSFGGAISYKLACVRPEAIRGAMIYNGGPVSGNNPAECTTPVAWFQSHGADDQIFNYQTGLMILDVFTSLNGCTAMTPPMPSQDEHTCVSFEGCAQPTRFCGFGSGQNNPNNPSLRGHYPSPKDPGQSTSWVPSEAWQFVTQF